MTKQIVFPLKIFYDGNCRVCAREMAHYRRLSSDEKLVFIDISDPEFSPAQFGRTREEFMAELHVIDAEGQLYRGVDAFRAIWQGLSVSIYGDLSALLGLPVIHLLARAGYRAFARMRRFLPPVKKDCEDNCPPNGRR